MKKSILAIFLFLLLSSKTSAHPHVWIENSLEFLMENKKISAINVKWAYDEFYSSATQFESDINDDKSLDTEEKLKLLDKTYEEFKKNNFFAHIKLNKQELDDFEVKNFNAGFKNEILITEFTIIPPKPIDPYKNTLTASFYDKTYFIEIYFQENAPVNFTGNNAETCEYKVYEDMTETYYYGMVNPETIKVICK